MTEKSQVACIQRIYPHYRSSIFDSLSNVFDFKLFHSSDDSSIKQITAEYSEFSKIYNIGGFYYLPNFFKILKLNPQFIIHEFGLSIINLYVLLLYCKFTSKKFILWGHGYNRKLGFNPSNSYSDKLRLFLMKRSDAIVVYVDQTVAELSKHVDAKKIYIARNSIDSIEKNRVFNCLSESIRPKNECMNISYVARLTKIKKPLLLVELALKLKELEQKYIIDIVGDGEMLVELKDAVEKHGLSEYFIFRGAIYEESLIGEIIYNSDFMFIPAWLGLSINNSLCYGTPVVTLSNEQHPPEISYAINAHNSVLGESVEQIAQTLVTVFADYNEYTAMRTRCRDYYCNNLSIDSMARGFIEAVENA